MAVTRHLALWAACALSVTTTASAYEDTGRPGPDGIWKVCSPAWAFPQLDAGAASKGLLRDYVKPRATVADQARCKYQLSNEGNDVSTGLKWQLYTDSVVVMPPPTMETWVLEGSLEPFVHYVPVQRDWSDLEARLAWAEAHPAAAANISANARAHVLKTLGASAASERRVVMAVLRGYRQALACAQSA